MSNPSTRLNPANDPLFKDLGRKEIEYMEAFHSIFSEASGPFELELLLNQFKVSSATVKKYLKSYLHIRPEEIPKILGFYPSADTVISLAEKTIGCITGENLYEINVFCKGLIGSITKPKHSKYLLDLLAGYVSDNLIIINKDELANLLYEDYVNFVHESDNGLVSIAGTMNEKILIRGLTNAGLIPKVDFWKTGSDSVGDLQVAHVGPPPVHMYCEIKSYAARERLLRGLQDINYPHKVGVGFFTNAAEFNPERTRTLLAANPLAIYMPDITYENLASNSLIQITRNQDKLYRPLSMYINDMVHFRNTGRIPPYI